ncbi:universal stress protein [Palleronia pelagia]|uniref:Nucleotide-binding universal stress protein, UspA family n=1 Tax=Palleronia pelagia TaxID=387096 RepID=A0A1H8AL44_9RHOB|nr:universal stress protein [Palleronia pelagia]SEM71460.1 Nucleotide-binding universal stress protein, UspA family [Palleronia pelagia]
MFKKILVPFDGSDPAEHALTVAANLAKSQDATLHVAFVPEPETTALAVGAGAVEIPVNTEELERHTKEVVDRAKTAAAARGCDVEPDVLNGRPADAILAHADKLGADLIVVGRRGMGTLTGLLMGSLSHKLIGVAKVPVMAVG